jgi:ABC-type antimicrobial peptide transport system permease subunit
MADLLTDVRCAARTLRRSPTFQIVGIVGDTRWWGTTVAPLNEVYLPFAQDRASFGFVIVRSDLDTVAVTRAIKGAFAVVLPGAALPASRRAVTMDDLIGQSIAGPRFNATLVSSFSALALALAVIGLFGLVACSVSQRRHELGIRSALGARPMDLIAMMMRSALTLTAIGIVIGLIACRYLTRFIESQLYGVTQSDAAMLGPVAMLMILAAGLAAYWPARRAALDDPMKALRHQS